VCHNHDGSFACWLIRQESNYYFDKDCFVTSKLGATAFCVTPFYRIVGDSTPTLVQNFIFISMDLSCESHFELFLITTHRPFLTRVEISPVFREVLYEGLDMFVRVVECVG
jgi:hypothetical protein